MFEGLFDESLGLFFPQKTVGLDKFEHRPQAQPVEIKIDLHRLLLSRKHRHRDAGTDRRQEDRLAGGDEEDHHVAGGFFQELEHGVLADVVDGEGFDDQVLGRLAGDVGVGDELMGIIDEKLLFVKEAVVGGADLSQQLFHCTLG